MERSLGNITVVSNYCISQMRKLIARGGEMAYSRSELVMQLGLEPRFLLYLWSSVILTASFFSVMALLFLFRCLRLALEKEQFQDNFTKAECDYRHNLPARGYTHSLLQADFELPMFILDFVLLG